MWNDELFKCRNVMDECGSSHVMICLIKMMMIESTPSLTRFINGGVFGWWFGHQIDNRTRRTVIHQHSTCKLIEYWLSPFFFGWHDHTFIQTHSMIQKSNIQVANDDDIKILRKNQRKIMKKKERLFSKRQKWNSNLLSYWTTNGDDKLMKI